MAIGGELLIDARLGEMPTEQVEPDVGLIELLHSLPDRAVLCSHGDVIPAVINLLSEEGMKVHGPAQWSKASVWVLQREAQRFVDARAWPPPELE